MVVSKEKSPTVRQSKAKWKFQNPKAKQSWVFKIPKQSKVKFPKSRSKAKQSGRQSKVSKVKAKQSSTPADDPRGGVTDRKKYVFFPKISKTFFSHVYRCSPQVPI